MTYATQRPLYSFKPDEFATQTPDLAASDAKISDGGRTVTVKLKPNISFSPPVNRAATSKDVKYAIERGFTAAVANGYVGTYFVDRQGRPGAGPEDASRTSAGIETPDDQTIVFKLNEPSGALPQGARAADHRAGARGVREEVRRQDAVDLRQLPGRRPGPTGSRPTSRARSPTRSARARRWCATRTGTPRPTSGPPTPTRSSSRWATRTRRVAGAPDPQRQEHDDRRLLAPTRR